MLSCGVVLILVIIISALIAYYFAVIAKKTENINCAKQWYVTRDEWEAINYKGNKNFSKTFLPIRLVVVQHTVSVLCHTCRNCKSLMAILQSIAMMHHFEDIPYNFLIGNDGRVYEGRGWEIIASHSRRFDDCSISVGFVGNYGFDEVSPQQIARFRRLLDEGEALGHLNSSYLIVGARDIQSTESPGLKLYNILKTFKHYDHENRYRDLVCEQIYGAKFEDSTLGWYMSRKQWDISKISNKSAIMPYKPPKLVIIVEQPSHLCYAFVVCKIEMEYLKKYNKYLQKDISYNFVVGNDGRVYEGRGWNREPDADIIGNYTACAYLVAFFGEYTKNSTFKVDLTESQVKRTHSLFKTGVKKGYLDRNYVIVGLRDLVNNTDPSDNLYKAIKKWHHYDKAHKFRGKTCEQIHSAP